MRTLISFAALFMSISLVQLGSGALGPLDALSGSAIGFSTTEIGVLGSAHFFGFFLGCWIAPRMLGRFGHVRTFTVFASAGAIGALAHPLWYDADFWSFLRILTGISVAGTYTVLEGWIQAKVTNATRGRVLGVYRVVDMSASLGAQAMIAVLPPAAYVSYNILAILCVLCLLPLTMTTSRPPEMSSAPRLRPIKAFRLSPLSIAGVVVAGTTVPAFRMVGPIYGEQIGLDVKGIAAFLGAAVLGGALSQIPAGWIADRFDRRKVLIVLSALSTLVCTAITFMGRVSPDAAILAAFGFGLFAFSIYSIASAHANDFASPDMAAELAASLLFYYGVSAIAAPYLVALLVEANGPQALFGFIATLHAILVIVGIMRLAARRTAPRHTPYRYLPRTSFVFGRLMKRLKSTDNANSTQMRDN